MPGIPQVAGGACTAFAGGYAGADPGQHQGGHACHAGAAMGRSLSQSGHVAHTSTALQARRHRPCVTPIVGSRERVVGCCLGQCRGVLCRSVSWGVVPVSVVGCRVGQCRGVLCRSVSWGVVSVSVVGCCVGRCRGVLCRSVWVTQRSSESRCRVLRGDVGDGAAVGVGSRRGGRGDVWLSVHAQEPPPRLRRPW